MVLKITEEMSMPEVQEVDVDNYRKQFKITTDVHEIDNIKGGSISGEDQKAYEIVKYGDDSLKEIEMVPNENYEIIGITVNGKEWSFEANEDGTYTIPQFENVTEDKHIIVTYALKNNTITINKLDSVSGEPISNVKFRLDQIEDRENPDNAIGEIESNGANYYELINKETNEVTGIITDLKDNGEVYTFNRYTDENDKLGDIVENGEYYFVSDSDGNLIPTNGKKYQETIGNSSGVQSKVANSYIPIDLSDVEGEFAVKINASISSESGCDYGYATVTQTTTAPAYSSTSGRFIYISGSKSVTEYTSGNLSGGNIYYLHLGYRKDGSQDKYDDQIKIHSIKVCSIKKETKSYNFQQIDGKYESNNTGINSTVANSYIPIDLTDYQGKYENNNGKYRQSCI